MGYAIAEQLALHGANVILISGPTDLAIPHGSITKINVMSANEMHNACLNKFQKCDAAIMAAAVADFTPAKSSGQKIKSENKSKTLELKLIPTIDIAGKLGELKTRDQKLIGFALETDDEEKNAMKKIKTKNLDFIVLNSLKHKGAGFGYDTNKITIIHKNNKKKNFELKSKSEVANDIVNELIDII